MFGFSIPKLALLIVIVLGVWYGFKVIGGRLDQLATKSAGKSATKGRGKTRRDEPEPVSIDTKACPACGTFVAADSAKACGRRDCPYPRAGASNST